MKLSRPFPVTGMQLGSFTPIDFGKLFWLVEPQVIGDRKRGGATPPPACRITFTVVSVDPAIPSEFRLDDHPPDVQSLAGTRVRCV
jgi:hypothetical protein